MNTKSRWFLLAGLLTLLATAQAQEYAPYHVKAAVAGGWIYPHDKTIIAPLVKGPVLGGEIAFEYNFSGRKSWQRDWKYPDVGIALQVLDLHNPDITGQLVGLYPYLNLPIVRNERLLLHIRLGEGVGFNTRPTDLPRAMTDGRPLKEMAGENNFALASPVVFNLNAGLDLDIRLARQWHLTLEAAWNHYSSGSLAQPNSGFNLLDGYVGVKYLPVFRPRPEGTVTDSIGRRWQGEIIACGGARKLYYKDDRTFGCASLSAAAYYQTCTKHRVGLGVDAFYDGGYRETVDNTYTHFKRTYLETNRPADRFRVGLNITNELIVGRLHIGLGVGAYLYDPVKCAEPYAKAKEGPVRKPWLYAYDIDKEDGWCYLRVSTKYYITPHLLCNISFKTHLQKLEFVEWGFGYAF
ncbi:MAG: acyloxyacyl hydrolase [Paludibacteraceae bacterium]|nr:acyloxyacyl hydrolase [Paludibacteraceae bacterium]